MKSTLVLLLGTWCAVLALTIEAKECRDNRLLEKECRNMRQSFGEQICRTNYFSIKKLMHKQCRATCGLCAQSGRALSPPIPCQKSIYGCCWDLITTALDRRGKGCPPCSDRHTSICLMFKWMCQREKDNADYIKMNCPVMCGRCVPDHKAEHASSIFYFYVRSLRKLYRHKIKKNMRLRRI